VKIEGREGNKVGTKGYKVGGKGNKVGRKELSWEKRE